MSELSHLESRIESKFNVSGHRGWGNHTFNTKHTFLRKMEGFNNLQSPLSYCAQNTIRQYSSSAHSFPSMAGMNLSGEEGTEPNKFIFLPPQGSHEAFRGHVQHQSWKAPLECAALVRRGRENRAPCPFWCAVESQSIRATALLKISTFCAFPVLILLQRSEGFLPCSHDAPLAKKKASRQRHAIFWAFIHSMRRDSTLYQSDVMSLSDAVTLDL